MKRRRKGLMMKKPKIKGKKVFLGEKNFEEWGCTQGFVPYVLYVVHFCWYHQEKGTMSVSWVKSKEENYSHSGNIRYSTE